jgi:hypothetical protein
MAVDDGAAHGQADSHPATLGRVEGYEQLAGVLQVEAHSGVAHGEAHQAP